MASPKIRKMIGRFHERIVETFHTPEVKNPGADALVALIKRHEECSRNLRNSVLTLVVFAAVCWVTLSKPDFELLSAQPTVRIPEYQVDVALDDFLAVAPLVMLVLLIHGSVFRRRLNALDPHVNSENRFSTLFNLPDPMASIATFLLHVFVPLALLVFLFVKTSRYEGFNWSLLVFAVALIVLAETHMHPGRLYIGLRFAARTITAALIVGAIFYPATNSLRALSSFMVPLDYSEVDFTKIPNLVLIGRNFRFANFRYANLKGLDLGGADLANADLRGANLTDARLANTSLWGANLTGALLTAADLTNADLGGADFTRADLTFASLTNAYLRSADLRSANISGADLTGAHLASANLRRASLTGANLTGANLTDTKLADANNLTQYQLDSACISKGGKPPTLPEGLMPPQNVCDP